MCCARLCLCSLDWKWALIVLTVAKTNTCTEINLANSSPSLLLFVCCGFFCFNSVNGWTCFANGLRVFIRHTPLNIFESEIKIAMTGIQSKRWNVYQMAVHQCSFWCLCAMQRMLNRIRFKSKCFKMSVLCVYSKERLILFMYNNIFISFHLYWFLLCFTIHLFIRTTFPSKYKVPMHVLHSLHFHRYV